MLEFGHDYRLFELRRSVIANHTTNFGASWPLANLSFKRRFSI
jgi:hypothetical protein